MNLKRTLLMISMLLALSSAVFAETLEGAAAAAADAKPALAVRTFTFKFKQADKAAAAIKPLLSADGSMSIQPSTNSLVVTDRAENMKAIAGALASFDTPPHLVRLSLHLVGAGRAETPTKVTPEIREIAAKLAVLRYNAIDDLGDANVEGHEVIKYSLAQRFL